MSDTTERDGLCGFCGAELEPMTVDVCGKEYRIGHQPCGCEGAAAARAAEAAAEAERGRMERRAAELQKLRECGVPERYLGAEAAQAKALSELWLDDMGFYAYGAQGTGKTHLAAAVTRRLVSLGCSARFVVVPDLMEAMRSRKAEDRDRTSRLAAVDVLVLDDLGKETPTPYACERLFDIVNARYNANLPIGVTSNFTRGEIAQRLAEGDVGRSIASRLCEMTRRVHLDGTDRRLANG